MATSLGVTLAKTLTVEPLANAANELALQKVQALVIILLAFKVALPRFRKKQPETTATEAGR